MKLTFLFCVIFSLSVSGNVLSQNKVNIEVQDVSIRKVFKEIKKQTGLIIIYSEQEVSKDLKISISLKNKGVDEALDAILEGVDLTYELIEDYVVIKPIKKQTGSSKSDTVQEKIKIRGKVIDEEGNPIPFTSIQIKGTSLGIVTDFDGLFEYEIEPINKIVLIVSSVGFKTIEYEYKVGQDALIVLAVKISTLSEVVVTGYQTLSRERVAGSFGTVQAVQLDRETVENIALKLEGKVAGLLIDKDDNGDLKVQIRGQSTLFADQEPLVIVDGLPIEGGFESIEPSDIQSVNILKDASAASIWGTRAANGVIVIETKGGSRQTAKNLINIDYSSTIGNIYDLSDLQLASSSQLVDFEYAAHLNEVYTERNIELFHGAASPVFQLVLDKPADITQQLANLKKIDHTKQVEELLMQRSQIHKIGLSIQTGSDKNTFYSSINATTSKSNLIGSSYERYNINLKNNYSITDKLFFKVALNSTLQNTELNNVSTSEIINRKPYELILDENGNYLPQTAGWHQQFIDPLQDYGFINWDYNLKKEIDNRNHTNTNLRNRMNAGLIYRPIDGLELSASFLYESSRLSDKNIANQNVYSTANMINQYTIYDEITGEIIERQIPLGSILTRTNGVYNSYTGRAIANYNTNLEDGKHLINVLVGFEIREVEGYSSTDYIFGYDDEALFAQHVYLQGEKIPNFYGNSQYFPNSYVSRFIDETNHHISYFGNLGYTLLEKYSLNASARVDKASVFGVDERFKNNPLWSVGVKWNIEREGFLPDIINRLDLRISYGYSGNLPGNIARTAATADYKLSYAGEQYLEMQSPKNNGLSFEKTSILNLGIDYAVWNNKISGTIEYFYKYSDDLLGYKQNDPTTGWSTIFSNYASVSNSGLELTLNYSIIKTKDYILNLGGNITFIKNRVDYVESPESSVKYYINGGPGSVRVDQPISALYNFQTAGVGTDGDYLTYDADGNVVVGLESYFLEFMDLVYSGQTDPTYFGGIYTSFDYKKISLYLGFSYKGGHVSRMPIPEYAYAASTRNTHESISNAWMIAGDENKDGVLPGVIGQDVTRTEWRTGAFRTDERVFDATSFRLKNIVLSYNLNLGKERTYNMKIFAEVKNVFVWTKNDLDIDPDYINPYTGQLRFRDPVNYTFGIKAKF